VLKHGDLTHASAQVIRPLVQQARLLSQRFDAVVANPPYMGGQYFTSRLKDWIIRSYKVAKSDLYSCFVLRNEAFAKFDGFVGMITIPNWMFLSSFEEFRKALLECHTIDSLIHNGRGVFGSDFGTSSFVIRNRNLPTFRGAFRRLFEKQGSVASNEELERRFLPANTYLRSAADFEKLPGNLISYWVSTKLVDCFDKMPRIRSILETREGLTTADNNGFLRLWPEVSIARIRFDARSNQDTFSPLYKWFPYVKGGEYRKWFGNHDYVVNWQNDGADVKQNIDPRTKRVRSHNYNGAFAFRGGITWNAVSIAKTGMRRVPIGFMFDTKSPMGFADRDEALACVAGIVNSTVGEHILQILSPTLDFKIEKLIEIPVLPAGDCRRALVSNSDRAVDLARTDWDSSETSWGFQRVPILRHGARTCRESQEAADLECCNRLREMKELEEENNRLLIDAYGLQDGLSPQVSEEEITLGRPNREADIKRLLSYTVGCMMGRYSLDRPGLIYAHSGNQGFDPSQYKKFRADDDGIIPLLETDWGIRDDATNRLVEYVGVAWPKEHLQDNLKFIADNLGSNDGEQPRDTIRRYLATGFYKHHLSMYKRRPIYWLFSSGKQRAFQCLIYLHRYHEGTLARMRTEYVIPLQSQIAARIEQLEGDKAKATSTSHRRKLQKEQDDLKKQQAELATFEEKLKHAADQKISLDLDDGVKVNYSKFGDLLAEAKAITGGKEEE
jgi:hypothetical protein